MQKHIRTVLLSSRDSKIVNQWLERWPSPHTRSCYRRDADRLFAHVRKPIGRISLVDLQSFAQSLIECGLAPISRARIIAAAKSLFSFCVRMQHLGSNPATELILPAYEKRLAERILPEEDVTRLLASDASLRDRALLCLLYTAGLRVSEACGLRWRNLHSHADAGSIAVFGKNGRTRSIALPPSLWRELLAMRGASGADDLVFPSRGGKRLDRGRVGVILRRAAKWAGLCTPASPHCCVTLMRAMRSIAAHRFTWYKPHWDTPPWPQQVRISTSGRETPARDSWLPEGR